MRLNRLSLRKKFALSALIAGCFAMAPQAHAVNLYWGSGSSSWFTAGNWTTNSTGTPITGSAVPTASDLVTFNGSTINGNQTVTMNAAGAALGLVFNNTGTSALTSDTTTARVLSIGGITVNSGAGAVTIGGTNAITTTLTSSQTWTNNSVNTLTVNSLAMGANPLVIGGTGVTTINGVISGSTATGTTALTIGTGPGSTARLNIGGTANTFTGDILINGGTLSSSMAGGAATSPLGNQIGTTYRKMTIQNGGTYISNVTWNDNQPSASNVGIIFNMGTGGGTVNVATGTLTIDDGTAGVVTTGSTAQQLQGTGSFTKTGTGTLQIRNQIDFTGTITISQGLMQLTGATGGFGAISAGTTIQSGAALNLNGFATTEAEPINISGTGLASSPVGVITNSSTTATSFSGPITLGAASQIGVSNSGAMTLSGVMTGAFPLTINNTGTGITVLSGASTAFTGGTTVKSGTLRVSTSANGLGANTNIITLGDTATLSPTRPIVLDMNIAGTVAQPIVLATGAFTGGLTISSPNATATTNVTGGITGTNNLNLGITGSWPLRFSGAAISNAGGITNTGTGTGTAQIDSNVTNNVTSITQNSLTSPMTLAGTNAYTGSTTITAGVLTFYNTASLPGGMAPTQSVSVVSTGVLGLGYGGAGQFTEANVTSFLTGAVPGVTFAAAGTAIGLDTTAGNATYTPAIGNIAGTTSSGLLKLGSNTLTVNPANTFTGAILIQNGALSTSTVGNVGTVSSGLGAQTNAADATIQMGYGINTGRLIYTGTGETSDRVINMLGGTGGAAIEQAGTGVLAFSSNLTFTGAGAKRLTLAGSTAGTGLISGSIPGGIAGSTSPLTIAKEGTGTWTLTGAGNTATTLVLSGGILDTGSNGLTISNAGAATIQTTADTTLNGKIILGGVGTAGNGADIGATAAGVTLTVNAIIEGGATNNIDFWSAPAGVTILNGANTFSGQVAIAGQIVQVTSINSVVGGTASSSLGAPTTVNEGTIRFGQLNNSVTGTLRYVGSGETTDRVISLQGTSGGAVIDQSGTGLLKFTSDLTATGAGSKTLTLQGSTAGTGEIGGAIVDNGGTNLTSVLKAGTGLWSLSGASTYTGTTTVNGGTLAISGVNGTTLSPTFNVGLGTTLLIDNLDTASNTNRIADAAVINVNGGTLDFSNNGGAVNYSESAGTLNIGSSSTSTVNTDQAALGQTSALTFNTLTRVAGGTVNFTGNGLGVDTRNRLLIASQAAGNLPVWATYLNTSDLAAYDASLGIVPATFTDIAAQSGVVPNGAGLNVRINSVGTPGNVTLASGTTAINLLLQNTTTASTIDLAGGSIASTGFKINPGMQALTIGATAGNGTLSAATAGGDVSFINSSSNPLTINSSIVDNASASTVSVIGGVTTLAGTNTYTGNTAVNTGTLNITGSLTGVATTSALRYGDAPGNTTVNISGNVNSYFVFTGANAVGSNTVMNLTAGSVTITPTTSADVQWVAKSGYGGLNITGGTFNTGRFDVVAPGGTNGVGVVYVGGAGILNNNVGDWLILPRTNGTGQLTVGPGGTLTRSAAVTAQLAITMDGTNSNGTLNIAGGNVDTGVRAIQFGFGTSATSTGNRGFVNLASGTLSVGLAINQTNTAGQYFDYFNFAGGTLKMNAGVTWLPATSVAGHTLAATIYGPVTNNNNANSAFNTQIGVTSNFTGGLTVDTNGATATTTIAAPLVGATGVGVTQADIGDMSLLAGNSGYFGAPAVVFSAPAAAGGVPASGYAVIDAGTGKVNGIVITNPGTYAASETPTITLSGGGGSIAPFTTAALATANTSGGLTKIGGGNLVLTGASSYVGDTNVNVGALIGGSPAALAGYGIAGKIIVASGATIGARVGGAGFTEAEIATLAANATISPTGYLGISTQNGSYVYASSIGGNYGLQKLEANTLTLTAANTYTGTTDVNAGILQVGNGGTSGTLGLGAVTVNTGTTLTFNRTDTYTLAPGNLFSGAGTIQLSNGGTVASAADNTFNMSSVLTFGTAANAATGGNLDLTLGGGTFTGLLSRTNSTTANTITIGAGKTLAINGNLDMTNTVDGATNLLTVTGAGTLNVTGASISVGRNTGGTNISSKATLDMSGLATFTANLTGNLTVQQQGDNNQADLAQLLLANNNTITAASVIVGGSATGAGTTTSIANQLKLGGGTNVIKTALVHLGSGSRDSGQVSFNGATGSVTLRDVAGTGRANVTMGPLATQTTAYVVTDVFDTTGHTADLAIGTFTTAQGAKTAANTHDLKFNSGTLDILTINMAVAKGTGLSTSKIEIGGGTAFLGGSAAFGDTGTGSVTLATQGSGELSIIGGTVTSSVDINRGATSAGTNAILTLNGGSLNMTNKSIGTAALPITSVNLQSGTLSNVLEINGGAAVSKTTAGTLSYTGTNAYTGATTVAGGKLLVNGSLPSSLVNVSALATIGGSGTIGQLTTIASTGIVAPGDSAGSLTFGGGVDLSAGGVYSWELGALSTDGTTPGLNFDLITVSGGNIALAGSSALTLDFALVGANGPNSGNAFWTAPKTWKIIDVTTGTNSGNTNLSTITNATYSSGSFTTTVGAGGDAGDVFLVFTPVVGGTSVWQGANNDPWTAAGSWTGSVPNSSAAEAKFITTGGTTANLDANQTVNKLTFDSTAAHTISGANTLTLAGTTPSISTAATNTATQTVAVHLDLAAGTSIAVNGGTLELNAPTNSTLGAGVTATVATGATLSLGGAGNALSNGGSTHANVANNGTLAATTAGKRVGNIDGTGTTTVTATNATLTANHIRQSTLNIGAGNTVTVATNGGDSGASKVTNLNINATGKLDLTNNDLIVDNGNLTTLTAQLASGLDVNGSYGGGPGITSSAFASDPNFNTVLGIAANSDLGYTSFSGQTVDNNDVLIKYTYFGDTDLNGVVDTATDFDLYITGLTSGGSLGGWFYGDFDYNGIVDSSADFDLFITGLTSQGSPLLTAGGNGGSNLVQAVPEPSTFVLGGLALLGFAGAGLRKRRSVKFTEAC